MSRIEFIDVEQKMSGLFGYYKCSYDPKKNPYKTSELTDDEYNFISGMNYVLSKITDNYLLSKEYETQDTILDKMKSEIAEETINEFAEYGYTDLATMITSFIDSHCDEDECDTDCFKDSRSYKSCNKKKGKSE